MTGTLMPDAKRTFLDNNGNPAVGSFIFFYAAGTATKQNAYSDVDLAVPLSNPTTLDAAGRVAAGGPFLTPGLSYQLVLAPSTDQDPPLAPTWTQDNVSAVPPTATAASNDVTGTAGALITAGKAVYLSDGSGGLTAGRWYMSNSANTYSSSSAGPVGIAPSQISAGATGTIRLSGIVTGLAGLTPGAIYYISAVSGGLTTTAPTNARAIGQADTTTSIVVGPGVLGLPAGSAAPGLVTTGAQTWAGVKTFSSAPIFGGAPTYNQGTAAAVGATVTGILAASVDTTQRANGTTVETTFSSYSLPASSLAVNGQSIRITAWGSLANNGNTKTIRIKFGGTTILTAATTIGNGGWTATAHVFRTGAATQKATGQAIVGGAVSAIINNPTSPAETLSGAVTVVSTGQSGTAGSDVLQEGFFIEFLG